MHYASVDDIQDRLKRNLRQDEMAACTALLADAAVIIDAYGSSASEENKRIVSCNMVIRALGDGSGYGAPIGATQGSISALGYSQSWSMSGGATGELYLAKLDKKLLGVSNRIGLVGPLQE